MRTERFLDTEQLISATSDETDDDGDNDGTKGNDPAGRVTFGDLTIDAPTA